MLRSPAEDGSVAIERLTTEGDCDVRRMRVVVETAARQLSLARIYATQ